MKILEKIENTICIVCLLAMTTLVFANVFSRYVLHLSLNPTYYIYVSDSAMR